MEMERDYDMKKIKGSHSMYVSFCNVNLKIYKLINKLRFLYINFYIFFDR